MSKNCHPIVSEISTCGLEKRMATFSDKMKHLLYCMLMGNREYIEKLVEASNRFEAETFSPLPEDQTPLLKKDSQLHEATHHTCQVGFH